MSVAGAFAFAVFYDIRAGYNSAAGVFAYKHISCNLTHLIQSLKRNNCRIGGNLKYAVGRCVYYRLACSLMLIAQHLYYLRTRSRGVAESSNAYGLLKLIHKFLWKSVWICFERNLGFKTCNLPVSRSGVLAL